MLFNNYSNNYFYIQYNSKKINNLNLNVYCYKVYFYLIGYLILLLINILYLD